MTSSNSSFWGESFIGRRGNNEDNFCIKQINENLIVLAVADGMGGTVAGEKASKIAIDTLIETFTENDFINDSIWLKSLLKSAYIKIQEKISEEIKNDPSLAGMGTTLTAALVVDGKNIIFSNLGDSRIYLIHKGLIAQITKDHSYIQEYQDKNNGLISPEIIRNYSNFITRTLDGGKDIPDIYPVDEKYMKLKKGSLLLLCSDGLVLYRPDENQLFKTIILDNPDVKAATKVLINNAYERGSTDNITVALYEFGRHKRNSQIFRIIHQLKQRKNHPQKIKSSQLKSNKSNTVIKYIWGGALLVVALLLAIIMLLQPGKPESANVSFPVKQPVENINNTPAKSIQNTEWNPFPDKIGLRWDGILVIEKFRGENKTYNIVVNGETYNDVDTGKFFINKKNGFKAGTNNVEIKHIASGKSRKVDFNLTPR